MGAYSLFHPLLELLARACLLLLLFLLMLDDAAFCWWGSSYWWHYYCGWILSSGTTSNSSWNLKMSVGWYSSGWALKAPPSFSSRSHEYPSKCSVGPEIPSSSDFCFGASPSFWLAHIAHCVQAGDSFVRGWGEWPATHFKNSVCCCWHWAGMDFSVQGRGTKLAGSGTGW